MRSIAGRLEVPGFHDTLGLPAARRYVVLVVDGMGAHVLDEHAALAPFLSGLTHIEGVVAGVPSTTAVSLTSLGTGQEAGQHGVVGYTSRVPATGERLNSLAWDQPVDPETWQPYPSVLSTIGQAGHGIACINDPRFEESGLTSCSQRGVPYIGAASSWERLDAVVGAAESMASGAMYTYESRLDHTGHGKGVDSHEWRAELHAVDAEIAALRAALPTDTALVVTADHGMIDIPMEGRFDVDDHRELLAGVTLLAGEARFRHLYTEPGAAHDVAGRWKSALGDRAIVRVQEDGLDDWFGPIHPSVSPRIGDVVVASLGDFAVFSSQEFPIETQLVGVHGSVTEAELAVPVLIAH